MRVKNSFTYCLTKQSLLYFIFGSFLFWRIVVNLSKSAFFSFFPVNCCMAAL